MKLKIGKRTEEFGIRIGRDYKKRVYAWWYHNSFWGKGNFHFRAVKRIIDPSRNDYSDYSEYDQNSGSSINHNK